ncbi:aryl-alcohol oxidase precursor [Mycena vulgaris]|nr:aryl-alcohol oxidase precursor [Mycena vulgaris]
MLTPAFLVLSLFSAVGLCKLYEDVADLPGLQYDFVIVGGGTAGNVVANRLTENPAVSVLVLEAGVSNIGILDSDCPFLLEGLFAANVWNWNYTTVPQVGLNGRTIPFPRAHFLGGSSGHNGMVYTRGAVDDFDRWANWTGDQGWSWNQLFPSYLKHETWTEPADHHNTAGQFNPAVHGTHGPVNVSLNGYAWPEIEQKVMQTTAQMPTVFPFNLDMNSGHPLGISWLQSTIGGGERSTSAKGYLAPIYIRRPNLHVLVHAQVSKLVNPKQVGTNKAFGGVQFRYGSSLFVANATKEIIIAGGPINTPQILLNSGIGNQTTLSALGIPTVLNLPSVGQNASDHPFVAITWSVNSTQTLESITQNSTRFDEAFAEWNTSRTGPFVDSAVVATHAAWLRLPPNSPAFVGHPDPSSGPGSPHIEFLIVPGDLSGSGPGNFMSMGVALASPISRGSVTINSSDPFAPPLIDPGYLSNPADYLVLHDGVALAQQFVSAPAWDGYIVAEMAGLATMTPAQLEAHIRDTTGESFHIVGTAAMSAVNAPYGVVNPDLRVKGTVGLSIIDASIMPIVPAAHTQAVTYAIAERGADLLKQRWA